MPEFDWDSLKDIIPDRSARPPAESFNSYDFMAKHGVSRNSAENTLKCAVENGTLKSGKFWNPERGKWLTYFWKP